MFGWDLNRSSVWTLTPVGPTISKNLITSPSYDNLMHATCTTMAKRTHHKVLFNQIIVHHPNIITLKPRMILWEKNKNERPTTSTQASIKDAKFSFDFQNPCKNAKAKHNPKSKQALQKQNWVLFIALPPPRIVSKRFNFSCRLHMVQRRIDQKVDKRAKKKKKIHYLKFASL